MLYFDQENDAWEAFHYRGPELMKSQSDPCRTEGGRHQGRRQQDESRNRQKYEGREQENVGRIKGRRRIEGCVRLPPPVNQLSI